MKNEPQKVTEAEVDAAIKKSEFTVLQDGRTTICLLTLDNNFTVRGESSCVDIRNFDEAMGERLSFARAKNEAWAYIGFRLADRIHQAKLRKSRGAKYRHNDSGLYVSPAYAKLNPKATSKET